MTNAPGDWVGQGSTWVYTPENALLQVTESFGVLHLSVNGDEWWHADFATPDERRRSEVGPYDELLRYPFHNPRDGGLDFSGEGRGCNKLYGWFEVDEVTYDGDDLQSIALRFEQLCESPSAPPLRGQLHWNTTYQPPAPAPQPEPAPAPAPVAPAPVEPAPAPPDSDPVGEEPAPGTPDSSPYTDVTGHTHEAAIRAPTAGSPIRRATCMSGPSPRSSRPRSPAATPTARTGRTAMSPAGRWRRSSRGPSPSCRSPAIRTRRGVAAQPTAS